MRRVLLLLLASWPVGCGQSAATRTALYGDLATLKKDIAADIQDGMSEADARDLAQAVARRELKSAKGETTQLRLNQLRTCVEAVRPELEELETERTDNGALAALLLYEAGYGDGEENFEQYRTDQSGAWRTLAARASTHVRWAAERRHFLVDGDERVRHAAIQAAMTARDPGDVEALLEAARLDPAPLNRSAAARAAAMIGGQRVVLFLRDLFDSGTEQEQMTVIDAWGVTPTFESGGERELLRVVETVTGLPSLAAARLILVHHTAGEQDTAPQVAVAALVRALTDGTREERRYALRAVPMNRPPLQDALLRAMDDPDQNVQVMAAARGMTVPSAKEQARARLLKLSEGTSNIALQARSALAAAGDLSVREALLVDLKSTSDHRRKVAAVALLQLGDHSSAALALADDSPTLRTDVACRMINVL